MADLDPPVAPPSVTPAPPAPQRGVKSTFSPLVDAFVVWLVSAVTQFNSIATWVSSTANTMYSWYLAAVASAQAAANSAAQAAASASGSIAAADLVATSTTSMAQGTGIKNFVIQTGKQFKQNMPVRFGATQGVWMDGYCRSYDPATGAFQFQSISNVGTGTFNSWVVTITGTPGTGGGPGGANSVTIPDSGINSLLISNTDPKLITVNTGSGGALMMDNPAAFAEGHNLFDFINESGNDLTIKNFLEEHLAYVPANRATSVHLKSSGEFVFPEANPIGKPIRYTGTLSSRVAGSGGVFVRMHDLGDTDRVLFLVYGISMHAIVYSKLLNQWSAPVLIRTAWGGTGAIDNVMSVQVDGDNVLVASCPENSTANQMVVVNITGYTITPGTAQTAALGAASARLLDLVLINGTYVLSYVTSANVVRLQGRTLSGSTVSAPGAEVAGPAGTAAPAVITSSATSFTLITGTATVLSMTPFTVSGTTLTGSTATTVTTTVAGFNLRQVPLGTFRWFITYVNTTAQARVLYFSGSTPTVTGAIVISSAVTTITGIQSIATNFNLQAAVTGTNAGGEFITEFSGILDGATSAAPTSVGAISARYSPTAQTVGSLGSNWNGSATSAQCNWMISTTKGIDLHSFSISNAAIIPTSTKTPRSGPLNYAVALAAPALYPKEPLHKATLSKYASNAFSTLGDGSKTPVYSKGAGDIVPVRSAPQLSNDPINGVKESNGSAIWLAYSMGTDANLTLEQVRMA